MAKKASRQLRLQRQLIKRGMCRQSCGRKAKEGSTYCWQCLKAMALRKRSDNSSGRGRPRHYDNNGEPIRKEGEAVATVPGSPPDTDIDWTVDDD